MKLAAVQLRVSEDREATIGRAGELIDSAAGAGAEVVLLPEFFAIPFVQPEPDPEYVRFAESMDGPSNRMAAGKSRSTASPWCRPFSRGLLCPGCSTTPRAPL